MSFTDVVDGLPPALQLVVVVMVVLFGGAVGFRRGKIQFIKAGSDEKVATAESLQLDDNAETAEKLRSHEIRLRELEACMFGIAVHLSNVVLCEPCKATNHQLLRKITEMVASEARFPKEREGKGS